MKAAQQKTKSNWLLNLWSIMATAFLIFQILSPISVQAQTTSVPGLKNCNFQAGQAAKGNEAVGNCLKDIFNFVFVISLFAIAIRVATQALQNYNPFNNGDADKKAISLIWDITLGLILIGGPVLILNTINPAALNLNFLNVGRLNNGSDNKANTPSGGQTTTGTNGNTAVSNNGTTTTDTAFNNAINDLNNFDSAIPVNRNAPLDVFASLLSPVQVNAQDANTTKRLQAEAVVKNVLEVQNRCQFWLIEQGDINNCQVLANSDTFKNGLNKLSESYRKVLSPLKDGTQIYSGNLVANRELEIMAIQPPQSPSRQAGCAYNYAQIQFKNSADTNKVIIYAKICSNNLQNSPIWQITGDKITPKTGSIPSGTKLFDGNQTIYLLN